MQRNSKRVLLGLAATGVIGGALAGGGVALASTGSSPAPAARAVTTASTSAATPSAAKPKTPPAAGRCDGGPGFRGPGPAGGPGPGGPGPGGPGLGGPGPVGGPWARSSGLKAAADYLGVTQAQLRTLLTPGKSLAAVATAKGKSVSGLEQAIITAETSQIKADSRLSAAQKTTLLSGLKGRVDAMVTGTRPAGPGLPPKGGPGPRPAGHGAMPGGASATPKM
jgi:hypothetical protein